jgi:hypothetical protein
MNLEELKEEAKTHGKLKAFNETDTMFYMEISGFDNKANKSFDLLGKVASVFRNSTIGTFFVDEGMFKLSVNKESKS